MARLKLSKFSNNEARDPATPLELTALFLAIQDDGSSRRRVHASEDRNVTLEACGVLFADWMVAARKNVQNCCPTEEPCQRVLALVVEYFNTDTELGLLLPVLLSLRRRRPCVGQPPLTAASDFAEVREAAVCAESPVSGRGSSAPYISLSSSGHDPSGSSSSSSSTLHPDHDPGQYHEVGGEGFVAHESRGRGDPAADLDDQFNIAVRNIKSGKPLPAAAFFDQYCALQPGGRSAVGAYNAACALAVAATAESDTAAAAILLEKSLLWLRRATLWGMWIPGMMGFSPESSSEDACMARGYGYATSLASNDPDLAYLHKDGRFHTLLRALHAAESGAEVGKKVHDNEYVAFPRHLLPLLAWPVPSEVRDEGSDEILCEESPAWRECVRWTCLPFHSDGEEEGEVREAELEERRNSDEEVRLLMRNVVRSILVVLSRRLYASHPSMVHPLQACAYDAPLAMATLRLISCVACVHARVAGLLLLMMSGCKEGAECVRDGLAEALNNIDSPACGLVLAWHAVLAIDPDLASTFLGRLAVGVDEGTSPSIIAILRGALLQEARVQSANGSRVHMLRPSLAALARPGVRSLFIAFPRAWRALPHATPLAFARAAITLISSRPDAAVFSVHSGTVGPCAVVDAPCVAEALQLWASTLSEGNTVMDKLTGSKLAASSCAMAILQTAPDLTFTGLVAHAAVQAGPMASCGYMGSTGGAEALSWAHSLLDEAMTAVEAAAAGGTAGGPNCNTQGVIKSLQSRLGRTAPLPPLLSAGVDAVVLAHACAAANACGLIGELQLLSIGQAVSTTSLLVIDIWPAALRAGRRALTTFKAVAWLNHVCAAHDALDRKNEEGGSQGEFLTAAVMALMHAEDTSSFSSIPPLSKEEKEAVMNVLGLQQSRDALEVRLALQAVQDGANTLFPAAPGGVTCTLRSGSGAVSAVSVCAVAKYIVTASRLCITLAPVQWDAPGRADAVQVSAICKQVGALLEVKTASSAMFGLECMPRLSRVQPCVSESIATLLAVGLDIAHPLHAEALAELITALQYLLPCLRESIGMPVSESLSGWEFECDVLPIHAEHRVSLRGVVERSVLAIVPALLQHVNGTGKTPTPDTDLSRLLSFGRLCRMLVTCADHVPGMTRGVLEANVQQFASTILTAARLVASAATSADTTPASTRIVMQAGMNAWPEEVSSLSQAGPASASSLFEESLQYIAGALERCCGSDTVTSGNATQVCVHILLALTQCDAKYSSGALARGLVTLAARMTVCMDTSCGFRVAEPLRQRLVSVLAQSCIRREEAVSFGAPSTSTGFLLDLQLNVPGQQKVLLRLLSQLVISRSSVQAGMADALARALLHPSPPTAHVMNYQGDLGMVELCSPLSRHLARCCIGDHTAYSPAQGQHEARVRVRVLCVPADDVHARVALGLETCAPGVCIPPASGEQALLVVLAEHSTSSFGPAVSCMHGTCQVISPGEKMAVPSIPLAHAVLHPAGRCIVGMTVLRVAVAGTVVVDMVVCPSPAQQGTEMRALARPLDLQSGTVPPMSPLSTSNGGFPAPSPSNTSGERETEQSETEQGENASNFINGVFRVDVRLPLALACIKRASSLCLLSPLPIDDLMEGIDLALVRADLHPKEREAALDRLGAALAAQLDKNGVNTGFGAWDAMQVLRPDPFAISPLADSCGTKSDPCQWLRVWQGTYSMCASIARALASMGVAPSASVSMGQGSSPALRIVPLDLDTQPRVNAAPASPLPVPVSFRSVEAACAAEIRTMLCAGNIWSTAAMEAVSEAVGGGSGEGARRIALQALGAGTRLIEPGSPVVIPSPVARALLHPHGTATGSSLQWEWLEATVSGLSFLPLPEALPLLSSGHAALCACLGDDVPMAIPLSLLGVTPPPVVFRHAASVETVSGAPFAGPSLHDAADTTSASTHAVAWLRMADGSSAGPIPVSFIRHGDEFGLPVAALAGLAGVPPVHVPTWAQTLVGHGLASALVEALATSCHSARLASDHEGAVSVAEAAAALLSSLIVPGPVKGEYRVTVDNFTLRAAIIDRLLPALQSLHDWSKEQERPYMHHFPNGVLRSLLALQLPPCSNAIHEDAVSTPGAEICVLPFAWHVVQVSPVKSHDNVCVQDIEDTGWMQFVGPMRREDDPRRADPALLSTALAQAFVAAASSCAAAACAPSSDVQAQSSASDSAARRIMALVAGIPHVILPSLGAPALVDRRALYGPLKPACTPATLAEAQRSMTVLQGIATARAGAEDAAHFDSQDRSESVIVSCAALAMKHAARASGVSTLASRGTDECLLPLPMQGVLSHSWWDGASARDCLMFDVHTASVPGDGPGDKSSVCAGLWTPSALSGPDAPFSHGPEWGPGCLVVHSNGSVATWVSMPPLPVLPRGIRQEREADEGEAVCPLVLAPGAPIDVLDIAGTVSWRPAIILSVKLLPLPRPSPHRTVYSPSTDNDSNRGSFSHTVDESDTSDAEQVGDRQGQTPDVGPLADIEACLAGLPPDTVIGLLRVHFSGWEGKWDEDVPLLAGNAWLKYALVPRMDGTRDGFDPLLYALSMQPRRPWSGGERSATNGSPADVATAPAQSGQQAISSIATAERAAQADSVSPAASASLWGEYGGKNSSSPTSQRIESQGIESRPPAAAVHRIAPSRHFTLGVPGPPTGFMYHSPFLTPWPAQGSVVRIWWQVGTGRLAVSINGSEEEVVPVSFHGLPVPVVGITNGQSRTRIVLLPRPVPPPPALCDALDVDVGPALQHCIASHALRCKISTAIIQDQIDAMAKKLERDVAIISAAPRPKPCDCWRRHTSAAEIADLVPGLPVSAAIVALRMSGDDKNAAVEFLLMRGGAGEAIAALESRADAMYGPGTAASLSPHAPHCAEGLPRPCTGKTHLMLSDPAAFAATGYSASNGGLSFLEHTPAAFGPYPLLAPGLSAPIALATPADAGRPLIDPEGGLSSVAGKWAVVDRGGCTFVQKARNAQLGGAIGVILVSDTDGVSFIPDAGSEVATDIRIPLVMVGRTAGVEVKRVSTSTDFAHGIPQLTLKAGLATQETSTNGAQGPTSPRSADDAAPAHIQAALAVLASRVTMPLDSRSAWRDAALHALDFRQMRGQACEQSASTSCTSGEGSGTANPLACLARDTSLESLAALDPFPPSSPILHMCHGSSLACGPTAMADGREDGNDGLGPTGTAKIDTSAGSSGRTRPPVVEPKQPAGSTAVQQLLPGLTPMLIGRALRASASVGTSVCDEEGKVGDQEDEGEEEAEADADNASLSLGRRHAQAQASEEEASSWEDSRAFTLLHAALGAGEGLDTAGLAALLHHGRPPLPIPPGSGHESRGQAGQHTPTPASASRRARTMSTNSPAMMALSGPPGTPGMGAADAAASAAAAHAAEESRWLAGIEAGLRSRYVGTSTIETVLRLLVEGDENSMAMARFLLEDVRLPLPPRPEPPSLSLLSLDGPSISSPVQQHPPPSPALGGTGRRGLRSPSMAAGTPQQRSSGMREEGYGRAVASRDPPQAGVDMDSPLSHLAGPTLTPSTARVGVPVVLRFTAEAVRAWATRVGRELLALCPRPQSHLPGHVPLPHIGDLTAVGPGGTRVCVGAAVHARWGGAAGGWYSGVITRITPFPPFGRPGAPAQFRPALSSYDIQYEDGDVEKGLPPDRVRILLPNHATGVAAGLPSLPLSHWDLVMRFGGPGHMTSRLSAILPTADILLEMHVTPNAALVALDQLATGIVGCIHSLLPGTIVGCTDGGESAVVCWPSGMSLSMPVRMLCRVRSVPMCGVGVAPVNGTTSKQHLYAEATRRAFQGVAIVTDLLHAEQVAHLEEGTAHALLPLGLTLASGTAWRAAAAENVGPALLADALINSCDPTRMSSFISHLLVSAADAAITGTVFYANVLQSIGTLGLAEGRTSDSDMIRSIADGRCIVLRDIAQKKVELTSVNQSTGSIGYGGVTAHALSRVASITRAPGQTGGAIVGLTALKPGGVQHDLGSPLLASLVVDMARAASGATLCGGIVALTAPSIGGPPGLSYPHTLVVHSAPPIVVEEQASGTRNQGSAHAGSGNGLALGKKLPEVRAAIVAASIVHRFRPSDGGPSCSPFLAPVLVRGSRLWLSFERPASSSLGLDSAAQSNMVAMTAPVTESWAAALAIASAVVSRFKGTHRLFSSVMRLCLQFVCITSMPYPLRLPWVSLAAQGLALLPSSVAASLISTCAPGVQRLCAEEDTLRRSFSGPAQQYGQPFALMDMGRLVELIRSSLMTAQNALQGVLTITSPVQLALPILNALHDLHVMGHYRAKVLKGRAVVRSAMTEGAQSSLASAALGSGRALALLTVLQAAWLSQPGHGRLVRTCLAELWREGPRALVSPRSPSDDSKDMDREGVDDEGAGEAYGSAPSTRQLLAVAALQLCTWPHSAEAELHVYLTQLHASMLAAGSHADTSIMVGGVPVPLPSVDEVAVELRAVCNLQGRAGTRLDDGDRIDYLEERPLHSWTPFASFPALAKFVQNNSNGYAALLLRYLLLRYVALTLAPLLTLLPVAPRSSAQGSCCAGDLPALLSQSRAHLLHEVCDAGIRAGLKSSAVAGRALRPRLAINRFAAISLGGTDTPSSVPWQSTLIGQAASMLSRLPGVALRQELAVPHLSCEVRLSGEKVVGEGGPYREFLTAAARAALDDIRLFIPTPNAAAASGDGRDMRLPIPSLDGRGRGQGQHDGLDEPGSTRAMLIALGVLMGCAMRTGVRLPLSFPPVVWKVLVGDVSHCPLAAGGWGDTIGRGEDETDTIQLSATADAALPCLFGPSLSPSLSCHTPGIGVGDLNAIDTALVQGTIVPLMRAAVEREEEGEEQDQVVDDALLAAGLQASLCDSGDAVDDVSIRVMAKATGSASPVATSARSAQAELCAAKQAWEELFGAGGAELTYSATAQLRSGPVALEMRPFGATQAVQFCHRRVYAKWLAATHIGTTAWGLEALSRGFHTIIPPSLSQSSFQPWWSLQEAVCGQPDVDVDLLKRHTEYGTGAGDNAQVVQAFWAFLRRSEPGIRTRVARFVFGQERLPSTDAEWSSAGLRLLIKSSARVGVVMGGGGRGGTSNRAGSTVGVVSRGSVSATLSTPSPSSSPSLLPSGPPLTSSSVRVASMSPGSRDSGMSILSAMRGAPSPFSREMVGFRSSAPMTSAAPPLPMTQAAIDRLLPTSDTCFGNLDLPAYSTPEVLEERLTVAISLDAGLDADEV